MFICLIFIHFSFNFVLAVVGACRTDWQEIDPMLMTSVPVYVDDVESAMQQSGDIIMSKVLVDEWYC